MPMPSLCGRLPLALLPCLVALCALGCDGQRKTPAPVHAAAPAPRASAPASGPGTPTVTHTLMDAGWGVPWGTVKLPAGWGFNGGVAHGDGGCMVMGDGPMWSAQSADKRYGIALLPALKTGYASDPNLMRQLQAAHCPLLKSTSANAFLRQYVLPHLHAGNVQVVSEGPEPQLDPMAQQFRQMGAQLEQVSNNNFSRMQATVDTARVLIQYQENGRTLNEVASTLFTCYHTQMAMPMQGSMEVLDCTAPLTVIAHGPEDGTPFTNASVDAHSKDPAFYEMVQSAAWTEHFNQKMAAAREQQQQQGQQLIAQGQQNLRNQQSQFEAGQARYRAQQQGYDQYNAAWRARQNKLDESHQAFNRYLSDTNVYTNPQTGQQYEMSNQYNNTYIHANGEVGLQTNSASSPGVDWTLLVPKY